MSEQPEFIKIQQRFSDHIKNPDVFERPKDVDDRHMAIYRDLFFKNVMGFLSGAFPVLAEIVGEPRWTQIGREFFSQHHNKTPYFLEISREFLQYLEHEYSVHQGDPDYFYELAHYEWLELYVDVEPEGPETLQDADGDLLTGIPLLSPVVEGYLYQYPVHQISLENTSPKPQPSALIVYRKRDDSVGFAETNSFTLQLLVLLKEQRLSGHQVIINLLQQSGLAGNEAAYQGGLQTLQLWLELGIVLGVKA